MFNFESRGKKSENQVYTDFIIKQMCYVEKREMSEMRIKVCKKLRCVIQEVYGFDHVSSGNSAVRMETSMHQAFFFDDSLYRQAIVWLVRWLSVE